MTGSAQDRLAKVSASWLKTAPLGRPVLPEVYRINDGPLGFSEVVQEPEVVSTRSTINFGLRSSLNDASSSLLTSGLRGAAVAPSFRMARNAITNSARFGRTSATRSP